MKIQDKDLYHGAALTQIVCHPTFKSINKDREMLKYGCYSVNDFLVFIKISTGPGPAWQFTFKMDDLIILKKLLNRKFFLCLVCSDKTICCMNKTEICDVLDLRDQSQQYIRVKAPPGGSIHVNGPKDKKLGHTISHNTFPDKLFL